MGRVRARPLVLDVAAIALILASVAALGVALGAWTGFPKGTDAYAHLTRLRFLAEHFPRHEWLHLWSAGMPTFETYPELPYLLAAPVTKLFGAPPALTLIGALGMSLLGAGLYGTVRTATGSSLAGVIAALAAVGSMATWTWIVNGGVYARVLAAGFGACACWAAAHWLGTGGRVAFGATAACLALAIASHQFIGALFAVGVGVATLAHPGPARVRRAAVLAAATALLAAPAVLPAFVRYGGFAGTFLGLDRPQLLSPASVVTDPRHIGIAVLPAALLGLVAAGGARAIVLLVVALALCLGYVFAPTLGIPSRFYYVNGIEPFTITFLVAIVGALAAGMAFGVARSRPVPRWRRDVLAALALLVAGNLWIGTTSFVAGRGYPQVEDTSASHSIEDLARRTILVNGDDHLHRFLPATASESVWFSYLYDKPQLRDYYLQGVVHPDWLAWVNAAIYTPPFDADRFRSAVDWFAIDSFSVFDDPNFTGNLAAFEHGDIARRIASSEPPLFRQFQVNDPGVIWRPTDASLLVVVGDRVEYDNVARMVLDRSARPGAYIPIWWPGTVDALPADLLARARTVLIQDGRFGDRAAAERLLESYARTGRRVVLDARASETLSELWPVTGAVDEAIGEWRLRAHDGIQLGTFAPAQYDGGPWGAPVGKDLRPEARRLLDQDGRPLVAARPVGEGETLWVGGNLFYHAQSYASDVEAELLIGWLGPFSSSTSPNGSGRRLDPERVEVTLAEATGVFVSESYHPRWTARWSDGTTLPVYYAGPGLIYVPAPARTGTLTLEFGRSWSDYAVWVLMIAGITLCLRAPRFGPS